MRIARALTPILVVAVLFIGVVTASFGQSTSVNVSGRVFDPNAAAVIEATVTAKNVDTGIATTVATNEEGIYRLVDLSPGNYEISVAQRGFRQVVKPGVVLHVADNISMNFTMQVGAVTDTIIVQGGAPLVNTQDATVSTVIDSKFVSNMPLNGKHPVMAV